MAGQSTDWGGIALAIGAVGALYLAYQSGIFNRLALSLQQPPAAVTSPLGYCSDGSTVNPQSGLCANGSAPTTIPVANPMAGQSCMGQDALGNSCPCPNPGVMGQSPFTTGSLLPQQQPNPYAYGQQTMYGYFGSFGGGLPGLSGFGGGGGGGAFGLPGGYQGIPSPYPGQPGFPQIGGSQYPYPGGASGYGSQPLGYAQGGGCNCTNCGGQNTITSQGYGQQSPYGQQPGYGIGGIGGGLYPPQYPGYPYGPIGANYQPYPPYPYPPQTLGGYPLILPQPVPVGIGIGGGIGMPILRGGRYGYIGRASADLNGYAGKAMAQDAWGLR